MTPTIQVEMTGAGIEAILERTVPLLDRILQRATAYALIRTPYAVTRVNWAGDSAAVWQAGITPDLARIHQEQVDAALNLQMALLRSAAAGLRTALAISLAAKQPLHWPAAGRAALLLRAELEKLVNAA